MFMQRRSQLDKSGRILFLDVLSAAPPFSNSFACSKTLFNPVK